MYIHSPYQQASQINIRVVIRLVLALTLSAGAIAQSTPPPLDGSALYRDVLTYSAFGEHRTGTAADHKTSEWLANELEGLGFDVERQRFSLKQFFPQVSQITIGDKSIAAFPHWFPKPTTQALKAPLAPLPNDPNKATTLSGHIAYLGPERAGPWHQVDVSALAEQAHRLGAIALIVAVPHHSRSIYARNAAEPYLQAPLPVPTLIIAASSAPALNEALTTQEPVIFELSGHVDENAYGINVIGKLDRGGDWIVISTPSSGWFTATGERGGGVALWLGAARWVAQHDKTNSYVFVSNSGHELDMMGSKYTLPHMPKPEAVALWLHLGASIGTRLWTYQDEQPKPLDQHNPIYLFADWTKLWTAWQAFSDTPEVNILPSFILPPDRGELVHFIHAGYPAMGFVTDHQYFHTPEDKPGVSAAELLAPFGKGVQNLLLNLQP